MTTSGLCVGDHGQTDPPENDIGYLCVRCFSRLRSSLLELPAIAAWLEVNVAANGPPGERVSGSRDDPIPLRVDVLDLIGPVLPNPDEPPSLRFDAEHAADQDGERSLFDEMRSWAALIEDESREDGDGFDWEDRRTLSGAVAFIARHLSWVAARPWVDEFAGAVRGLISTAHHVAPWREVTMRDQDPCDRCGVRAVVLHVAASTLKCEKRLGGCGKTTVSDYLKQARTG